MGDVVDNSSRASEQSERVGGGREAGWGLLPHGGRVALLLFLSLLPNRADGQQGLRLGGTNPGGVLVAPDGMAVTIVDRPMTAVRRRRGGPYTGNRFISLRRLSSQISPANNDSKLVALGGLQRIDHILIYPEQDDIVFCGRGDEVKQPIGEYPYGASNGLPCLTIEDLRSCWFVVSKNRAQPFGCSISPTPNGLRQMQQRTSHEPPPTTAELAEALGPQRVDLILLSGKYSVDHIIVGADIHLKRLALGIDSSEPHRLAHVQDLGKLLEGVIPRVWIDSQYRPIGRSQDGRAWSLSGSLAMHLDVPPAVEPTSTEKRKIAAWCSDWTEAINTPRVGQHTFRHLQGICDLAVAFALLQRHNLISRKQETTFRWTKHLTRDLTARSVPRATESFCRIDNNPRRLVAGGILLSPWEAVAASQEQPPNLELWEAGRPPDDLSIWTW